MKSKAAAPSKRVYEDFEPECKWNNEEGRDIIELHVQGTSCTCCSMTLELTHCDTLQFRAHGKCSL